MDIQKHPILKKLYDLSTEIEKLGASESFTALLDMVDEISKDADMLVDMSDWTVLAEKEPGIEYLDHEEDKRGFKNSILMVVVANTEPRGWYVARWNYDTRTFFAEFDDEMASETLDYHTKLWKPLPLVTDEKWMRSFPRIQMSQDKSYEDEILLGQQLELEEDED